MKKIKVNDDMCIGCGYCCASSDVFDMNDEGRAFAKDNNLDEMDNEKKEELLEIKEGCPVGAIEVVEEIKEGCPVEAIEVVEEEN